MSEEQREHWRPTMCHKNTTGLSRELESVLSPCRRGGVRVKRKSGVSPVTLRGSDRQHARCDGDSLSRMTSSAQADNKDETEKKEKKKSRGEKIKFYLSAASLTLLFSSLAVFLFLIPFIIDPAVASLRGEISQTAVSCRVVTAHYRLGVSRCDWSSCREGCTQVLTLQTHQIYRHTRHHKHKH